MKTDEPYGEVVKSIGNGLFTLVKKTVSDVKTKFEGVGKMKTTVNDGPVGWVCPKCGTCNNPTLKTCRNPSCQPTTEDKKTEKELIQG